MLNHPSRPLQENVFLHLARALRLLATFATVALITAATLHTSVRAGLRERFPRRSAPVPVRAEARSYPVAQHRARHSSRSSGQTHAAHTEVASHRGRRSRSRAGAVNRRELSDTTEAHGRETHAPKRLRGESHAAYNRRLARLQRERRVPEPSERHELANAAQPSHQSFEQGGVFASGAAHPQDFEHRPATAAPALVSPDAVAKGPQVSAKGPVPVSASSAQPVTPAQVQPAGSARELAQAAVEPKVLPLYNANGHLIVPPPLRGSREILVHQNQMADAAGLERIQNDGELDQLRTSRRLVNLASSESLQINPELPDNRRCARPWTAHFAADIARAYYARFGQPLELNSAVRTISYQIRLQRVNGNAAATNGETASPHLTGQAIDFGKRGMSMAEIAWMRNYLSPLMQSGLIDVEEEFQQSCFHISVYRDYGAASVGMDVAQVGGR